MAWEIRYDSIAVKRLSKMDRQIRNRILDYMDEVGTLDDPRTRGKGLTGNLSGLWRYRVGDYRVICDIEDSKLVILAIDIDHRSEVYKSDR